MRNKGYLYGLYFNNLINRLVDSFFSLLFVQILVGFIDFFFAVLCSLGGKSRPELTLCQYISETLSQPTKEIMSAQKGRLLA